MPCRRNLVSVCVGYGGRADRVGIGRTRRQEQETEDQIKKYEIERTFSEKQQMIVEEGARERQKKYDKILERRERYDEMVTDLGL